MDAIRQRGGAAGAVLPAPVPGRWRRRENLEPVVATEQTAVRPVAEATTGFGAPFTLFCILTLIIFARPADYLPFLMPLRLALVFTIITVAATVLQLRDPATSPFKARETKLYLIVYVMMVAGIPFAVYRPEAFEFTITKYIVNVVYFILFLAHVDSVPKLKRIASLLVVSVFVFTVFGLKNGQFITGRYDVGGSMFDPNDVAFVEVSLFGYALWVVVGRFGLAMKGMALATLLLGSVLTLYTASRGGLLGLITFLLLFLWLRVHRVGKVFKGLLLVALLAGAYMNADKLNYDRYQTLGSLEDDYNLKDGGRVDNWKRGFRLFVERPITGVGVGSFAAAVGWQRTAEGKTTKWTVAHSTYIEVLTEMGGIGAACYFMLIGGVITTFNRLRRMKGVGLDPELSMLPGLLLIGFGAQLVTGMFLSQAYSMFFTLAFAMAAALNRITAKTLPIVPVVANK